MKTHNSRNASSAVNLGFQIAPMIDVVFVIMLFFMVMSGNVQVENRLNTRLPSYGGLSLPPDEVAIRIEDDGQVFLNDDPLDTPESKALPELTQCLNQLRDSNESSNSKMLVTIYADNAARFERVVDTLDSLTRAKISDVTFQAGSVE